MAQQVVPVVDVHAEAVVRAQITGAEALAPRSWRVQGTGTPFAESTNSGFDFSDSSQAGMQFDDRTGARPLYATDWAIGTEATADAPLPRFPVGSSPLIEERPVMQPGGTAMEPDPVMEAVVRPTASARTRVLELLLWSIVLISIGLGIGATIATLAT